MVSTLKAKRSTATSDISNSRFKFNRRNHYFTYESIIPKKENRPVNWSNMPNIRSKKRRTCGNEYFVKRNKTRVKKERDSYLNNGTWEVYMEDNTKFLVLE